MLICAHALTTRMSNGWFGTKGDTNTGGAWRAPVRACSSLAVFGV